MYAAICVFLWLFFIIFCRILLIFEHCRIFANPNHRGLRLVNEQEKKKNTSTRIGCEIIEVKASKKSVKNISRKSDTRVRYEVQMNFFPFRKCRMNFVDAFHVKKMIASEKRKKKAVVGHHLRKYHWYVNGNAQSTGVYIRIKWSWSLYWERSSYNRTIVHDISCLRSVQDCWSCCCSSW